MAYDQVQTVLNHVAEFHDRIGEVYKGLSARVTSERTRLMLNSMKENEAERAAAVKEFIQGAPAHVMETWVTTATDSEVLARRRVSNLDDSATLDDLIELAMKFSDELSTLYCELACRGEPEEVRELFKNFLDEEQQEERQLVVDALRAQDL